MDYEWIHDDITWCGNECHYLECERNIANRLSKEGLFSMAMFRNTETCPLYEREKYYFITVFSRLDLDEKGWTDTGNRRCWGFYKDKDRAFQAVHENLTDLNETIYDYALIEEYEEGISGLTGFRQFFKFDGKGYVEIEEPKGYGLFSGFALG